MLPLEWNFIWPIEFYRIEILCHDINVHVPHHISPRIPSYNLRAAYDSIKQNWGKVLWISPNSVDLSDSLRFIFSWCLPLAVCQWSQLELAIDEDDTDYMPCVRQGEILCPIRRARTWGIPTNQIPSEVHARLCMMPWLLLTRVSLARRTIKWLRRHFLTPLMHTPNFDRITMPNCVAKKEKPLFLKGCWKIMPIFLDFTPC